MKEAMFYKTLDKMKVQCELCPNECVIVHGKRGVCGVRENKAGRLYTLVHGLPVTTGVDPIEKKPLFQYMPGTMTYSIATAGCNLRCMFCQNWNISQKRPEDVESFEMSPKQVVENAVAEGCKSISYTYIEPTIFYEFLLETAQLAHKAGLKNIVVTNGYINKEPLKKLYKFVDAANVDVKGFSEEFYKKYCGARLEPVLDAVIAMKKMGVWVEVTNLVIPTLNDDAVSVHDLCAWIVSKVGKEVPLHLSRFFPHYQLMHLEATPIAVLDKAYAIAKESGLQYVYLGNVQDAGKQSTLCPKCSKIVVKRDSFYRVVKNSVEKGKCPHCGCKVDGEY